MQMLKRRSQMGPRPHVQPGRPHVDTRQRDLRYKGISHSEGLTMLQIQSDSPCSKFRGTHNAPNSEVLTVVQIQSDAPCSEFAKSL